MLNEVFPPLPIIEDLRKVFLSYVQPENPLPNFEVPLRVSV